MDKKDLILAGIVAACVLGLVLTRTGGGDRAEPAKPASIEETDILRSHTVEHFLVHDIRISDETGSEVVARRDQGKIKVEIDPGFLAQLPDTFLASLGWEKPVNWVSDEGFQEFLEILHLQVAPEEGDGWEMEGHEQDHEHDHEHDHEGHDHDH